MTQEAVETLSLEDLAKKEMSAWASNHAWFHDEKHAGHPTVTALAKHERFALLITRKRSGELTAQENAEFERLMHEAMIELRHQLDQETQMTNEGGPAGHE